MLLISIILLDYFFILIIISNYNYINEGEIVKNKEHTYSNLGIIDDIETIDVEDIYTNKIAIKMLLHNYKKIEEENTMLKQDLNRQATIERALSDKEKNTNISTIFGGSATVLTGFGISFITSNIYDIKGWIVFIFGIISEAISIYYSIRKDDNND